MHSHTSRLLRSLIAGLAFSSLSAIAQDVVVVVGSEDSVTDPISEQPQKQSFVSLIAAANLAQQGVTAPTAENLGMAESSVQAMRDSGMGWGEIANAMNVRLGDVVSAANRAPRATETLADRAPRTTPRDAKVAAASDTASSVGVGASKSGQQGGNASGGNSGGGKGGGASGGGGNGGGKRGGKGGGNSGGKGGGNGGGKR